MATAGFQDYINWQNKNPNTQGGYHYADYVTAHPEEYGQLSAGQLEGIRSINYLPPNAAMWGTAGASWDAIQGLGAAAPTTTPPPTTTTNPPPPTPPPQTPPPQTPPSTTINPQAGGATSQSNPPASIAPGDVFSAPTTTNTPRYVGRAPAAQAAPLTALRTLY